MEILHSVNYLLLKHEDQSSTLSSQLKCPASWYMLVTQHWRDRENGIPGELVSHQPSIIGKLQVSVRDCLKTKAGRSEGRHLVSTSGPHTCTHVCRYPHVHTHKCIRVKSYKTSYKTISIGPSCTYGLTPTSSSGYMFRSKCLPASKMTV